VNILPIFSWTGHTIASRIKEVSSFEGIATSGGKKGRVRRRLFETKKQP
jgi:hypothetical protein